jgi:hypothetical protein
MTSSRELEGEVEASRARLDQTLGALQDRLSVSGAAMDHALGVVRRNPLAALAVALAAGWALYTLGGRSRRRAEEHAEALEEESIPVLNTGHARIYDPDVSPRHPTQDLLETRREMNARA